MSLHLQAIKSGPTLNIKDFVFVFFPMTIFQLFKMFVFTLGSLEHLFVSAKLAQKHIGPHHHQKQLFFFAWLIGWLIK